MHAGSPDTVVEVEMASGLRAGSPSTILLGFAADVARDSAGHAGSVVLSAVHGDEGGAGLYADSPDSVVSGCGSW
jgi:hypothetical protein